MTRRRPHPPIVAAGMLQRGVVLLYSLIALAIMLIAAVAVIRYFQSSLFTAGNIAFKRDMQNQSERAVDVVLKLFNTGALSKPASRANNLLTSNYSASMLAVNAQGIPNLLGDNTAFTTAGYTNANDITVAGQAITIRYVVDRLCSSAGDPSEVTCIVADNPAPAGTSSSNLQGPDRILDGGASGTPTPTGSKTFVYRLSIRVNGPRNTQAFFQSTFATPN